MTTTQKRRLSARIVSAALTLALVPNAAIAQDTGVMDMTGMGIYAEEEAVIEAAEPKRVQPKRARKAARKLSAQDERDCAAARGLLARFNETQMDIYRETCL